ncbi:MAG: hypothetical protein KF893_15750 [Caldilineaceae bacterium]|nr:hypothetical protein [Caldilineaceae bacterium]
MPKRGKINLGDLNPREAEPAHEDAGPVPTPTPDLIHEAEAQRQKETGGPAYDPPPRRPRAERENAFDFGSWLLEGVVGLAEELRHNDLGLPEEFWTHAYAARKEALLAARSLLDVAIERCDETHPPLARRKPRKQRGNVNINFR